MPFGVGLIYLDNNLFDSFDSFERSIDRLCAAEARLSAERLCSRRFALFDFSNLESRRNNCSIRAQRASTPPVRSVLYLGVWARVIDPASGTVGGMTRGYRRSRKEGLLSSHAGSDCSWPVHHDHPRDRTQLLVVHVYKTLLLP